MRTDGRGRAREFEALDGLRGWAVLMVFNVHFFTDYWQQNYALREGSPFRPLLATIHTGHVGVDLFFVLSGFLIYYTLQKRPTTFAVFMKHRYARLLPAHLAVLLPLLLPLLLPMHVATHVPMHGASLAAPPATNVPHAFAERLPQFFTVAANVLLIQSLIDRCPILNFVTWSLSYELLWYVLAAAWLLVGYRRAFFRSYRFFFLVCGALYAGQFFLPAWLLTVGVKCPEIPRFMGFFFGFLVAKLFFESTAIHERLRPILVIAGPLSVAAVVAVRFAWTQFEPLRTTPRFANEFYFALDVAFALLLLSLLIADRNAALRRFFSLLALRALGRVSYSFYLVHALYALPLMARVLHRPLRPAFSDLLLAYVVALFITTAMACVCYLLFERPYLRSRQNHTSVAS